MSGFVEELYSRGADFIDKFYWTSAVTAEDKAKALDTGVQLLRAQLDLAATSATWKRPNTMLLRVYEQATHFKYMPLQMELLNIHAKLQDLLAAYSSICPIPAGTSLFPATASLLLETLVHAIDQLNNAREDFPINWTLVAQTEAGTVPARILTAEFSIVKACFDLAEWTKEKIDCTESPYYPLARDLNHKAVIRGTRDHLYRLMQQTEKFVGPPPWKGGEVRDRLWRLLYFDCLPLRQDVAQALQQQDEAGGPVAKLHF